MPQAENLVRYSFIIKGKVGRGERPLSSSFLSRHQPSIISSSFGLGTEVFFLSLRVKPGLSWHDGKIISGLSTMRVFHFEESPSHKWLFLVCTEPDLGSLTWWPPWACCRPYFQHFFKLSWGHSAKNMSYGSKNMFWGVTNSLSSLGRMWSSCHCCFCLFGDVSSASVAWFCC